MLNSQERKPQPSHVDEVNECLVPPEWKWYKPGQGLSCKEIMLPLIAVTVLLGLGLVIQLISLFSSPESYGSALPLVLVLLVMLGLMGKVILFVKRFLLNPLSEIRLWVSNINGGDFSARMPTLPQGEFNKLAQDINGLATQIESLNRDFMAEVESQTEKLARKTQALELLYEVVTSVNEGREINELLSTFMHRLGDVYDAQAMVLRILDGNQLLLSQSYGLDEKSSFLRKRVPVRFIYQNHRFEHGAIDVRSETINETLESNSVHNGTQVKARQIISIPLQYRDSILGCYQLFVDSTLALDDEARVLLVNLGQHLGTVLQQSKLDEDTSKLMMVEERTRLANELHDSLAQTLASLRFQVRLLDDSLHQGDERTSWEELEKLEAQVDEANHELRVLIGQFRAPLKNQEVVLSVSKLVEKFRRDTGISVFLQNEWTDDNLTSQMRMDVIRIVQEALANIRKHAEANTVRVLIRHKNNRYRVVVEDDGKGFDSSLLPEVHSPEYPGEHIGHQIMAERASNLNSELKFESELGEGCLLSIEFEHYRVGEEETPEKLTTEGVV